MTPLTLIFFGDVVGRPGRAAVRQALPQLAARHGPAFVVVNAENAEGGSGLGPAALKDLSGLGIGAFTTGDHFFRHKEFAAVVDDPRVLRPANYPPAAAGKGWGVFTADGGVRVGVLNLMGRLFMDPQRCPFEVSDELLPQLQAQAKVILVDFHAETTGEKMALGWHLDGRVSALLGTHTHVQTADERLLPQGTAYLSDTGMCGPYDSVIGRDIEPVLKHLRTGMYARFTVAKENVKACGAVVRVDAETGKALSIERFQMPMPSPAAGNVTAGSLGGGSDLPQETVPL